MAKWSSEQIEVVLRDFGVHQGQTVLDFGCGEGTYTIPAARIVGKHGTVYALDQAESRLDTLRAKAKSAGINIPDLNRENRYSASCTECCVLMEFFPSIQATLKYLVITAN